MGSRAPPLRLRSLRSLLALALFLTANVAFAAPSAVEKETARKLMDDGKARLKANDPVHAVEAFQKAHDIMHVPTTGLALAKAHAAAGELLEARDLAAQIARSQRDAGEPAVFEAARKHARELEAQLRVRIPTIHLKMHDGVAARVTVDDAEAPLAMIGEPLPLNPGKHTVVIKSTDGPEVTSDVDLAEKDAREIDVTFPAVEAPKTVKRKKEEPAVVAASAKTEDMPAQGERTTAAEVLIYGGFGLGAIGLTTGIITGALAVSKGSELQQICPNDICAPGTRDNLDTARSFATISNIAIAIGVVGVALGVIGVLLPRRPAHTAYFPLGGRF